MDRRAPLAPESAAVGNDGAFPARRILLVEDHEDTLAYLRRHLEAGGHSVSVARTLMEARAVARDRAPDILLCDITLPDGDGCTLLADFANPRPALCIAMSGYGMSADRARSRDAGFDHHLTKPFLPDDLDTLLSLR